MLRDGELQQTRNGAAWVAPAPVMTVYERPWERVLFCPKRDANPFFHLFESVWMLGGRNDVKSVDRYVKQMKAYSDDGKTFHAAYGHRWRVHFGKDQVRAVAKALAVNPRCRRQVIAMWDARADDSSNGGLDLPCNTHTYAWIDVQDRLSLTVCCRSNDMIWGAYGANAVHFSFLQQALAEATGRRMGKLYQLSNNFHAYEAVFNKLGDISDNVDPYFVEKSTIEPGATPEHSVNLLSAESSNADGLCGLQQLFEDIGKLLDEGMIQGLRSPFLRTTVVPMIKAHDAYKAKNGHALEIVEQVACPDWRRAGREWLQRRAK